jgi:peptidylprolyl isomerase
MVAYKYRRFMRVNTRLVLFIALFGGFLSVKAQLVEIVTEQGTMKLLLYKDTPLHTANFLRNIKDQKYNNVLFHRVMKDFMIQTGDPNSTKAKPGELVGNDSGKEVVKAEIMPNHNHKRGALAAARQPDASNPQKNSSQYQFYIVDGRDYSPYMLKAMENKENRKNRYKVADSILYAEKNFQTKRQLDSLMNAKDFKTADKILEQMYSQTDSIIGKKNLFKFSDRQISEYTTVGGAPNLDGKYTVFGEVIQGLEIIDLIAEAATDANNRPVSDIHILKITILEE